MGKKATDRGKRAGIALKQALAELRKQRQANKELVTALEVQKKHHGDWLKAMADEAAKATPESITAGDIMTMAGRISDLESDLALASEALEKSTKTVVDASVQFGHLASILDLARLALLGEADHDSVLLTIETTLGFRPQPSEETEDNDTSD